MGVQESPLFRCGCEKIENLLIDDRAGRQHISAAFDGILPACSIVDFRPKRVSYLATWTSSNCEYMAILSSGCMCSAIQRAQAAKRGIDNAQVGAVALAVNGPLNVRGLELPAIEKNLALLADDHL